jgi:hypothetical protein
MPGALAVAEEGQTLAYGPLNVQANKSRIICAARDRGREPVASMHRPWRRMIAALLGVLKAGLRTCRSVQPRERSNS